MHVSLCVLVIDIVNNKTTLHSLQANGLDERWNQTLQQMLVKFVAEKREMWEEFLDTCVFSYNTSKHSSSKYVLAYCGKV